MNTEKENIKMRLEFGNPKHIELKKSYERTKDIESLKLKLKGKVRCPFCSAIKKEVVDYNLSEGWILWEGCGTAGCRDNGASNNYDASWDGMTDLNGKVEGL
jgi:transcription elongation factor Elf1